MLVLVARPTRVGNVAIVADTTLMGHAARGVTATDVKIATVPVANAASETMEIGAVMNDTTADLMTGLVIINVLVHLVYLCELVGENVLVHLGIYVSSREREGIL